MSIHKKNIVEAATVRRVVRLQDVLTFDTGSAAGAEIGGHGQEIGLVEPREALSEEARGLECVGPYGGFQPRVLLGKL